MTCVLAVHDNPTPIRSELVQRPHHTRGEAFFIGATRRANRFFPTDLTDRPILAQAWSSNTISTQAHPTTTTIDSLAGIPAVRFSVRDVVARAPSVPKPQTKDIE